MHWKRILLKPSALEENSSEAVCVGREFFGSHMRWKRIPVKPSASDLRSIGGSCLVEFCGLEGNLILISRFFGFLNFECAVFILNSEAGTWTARVV